MKLSEFELIRSIHDLENYLTKFEEKYRLLSDDFYRLATTGKLEQSNDFIEWLGVYEIKLKREQKYQQRIDEILAKQQKTLHLPLIEPAGV
ncbi:MAG: hypothetical protein ACE5I1_25525 [bacterium]